MVRIVIIIAEWNITITRYGHGVTCKWRKRMHYTQSRVSESSAKLSKIIANYDVFNNKHVQRALWQIVNVTRSFFDQFDSTKWSINNSCYDYWLLHCLFFSFIQWQAGHPFEQHSSHFPRAWQHFSSLSLIQRFRGFHYFHLLLMLTRHEC